MKIYPYIHFKYFIPKIKINKKTQQKEIHISYAYPIINDIINELYEELIYYTSKFNNILTSKIGIENFEDGQKIITEGETGDKFYIVKKGKVDI